MQIKDKVKDLLEPIAKELKYCVLDITYRREGGKHILRITVDKEDGITMDECAALSNRLSEILDRENVIEEHYLLEVSSPGLDRKLKTNEDFVWAVGKRVRVNTYTPLEGKSVFSGVLLGLGEGTVVVDESGVSTEIPKEKIASAKLEWSDK